MNEEEKKAIKRIEKHLIEMLNKYEVYNDCLDVQSHYRNGDIKILLNLIENQQKELDSLKEIEKSHKEENGLLRQELDMQIEHNKELDNILYAKQSMIDELTINEGNLKIELAKEQEKRKDIEEKLKITVAIITRGMYPEQNEGDNDFDRQFVLIRKDKIKEKIEEWDKSIKWNNADDHYYAINILKELLEEK